MFIPSSNCLNNNQCSASNINCSNCIIKYQENQSSLDVRFRDAEKLMDFLGIYHYDGTVDMLEIYEIFSNPDKLKEIVTKMKMKVFW